MTEPDRNPNQYGKLLMFAFAAESTWEEDAGAWRRRANPVYRKPQDEWAAAIGHGEKWIYFIPKTVDGGPEPSGVSFPDWVQCYWDPQSGRWIIVGGGGGGGGDLFLTPEGGIPAMSASGDNVLFGRALCFQISINDLGSNILEGATQQATAWVYNSVSGAIPAGVVIQAKRIKGYWFADVVDCQATADFGNDSDNPFLEDDPFDEGLTI